jgi:DNA-binding SARP family transcriptional activator
MMRETAKGTRLSRAQALKTYFLFLEMRHKVEINNMTGWVVECPIDELNRPRGGAEAMLRIPRTDAEIDALFAGWREELATCRRFGPTARNYAAARRAAGGCQILAHSLGMVHRVGAMPGTRFLLLGLVEADRGGERLPLGRRRERSLLAVLLLAAGRPVPQARLVDLLWDGDPPGAARASLHSHVSRLRTGLDPDGTGRYGVRLSTRDGGYAAEVDPAAVDAHRFTDLVVRARAERDPTQRGGMLREALALWRGPALADAGSALLRRRVAADLEELRLSAIELVLDADLDCGRHREVAGEAARLTGEHPLREGLWARLSLALYRCGRQAEALDALAQARDRLVTELGLAPSPQLRQLQHRILNADPALDPPAASVQPTAEPVPARQLPMDIAEFTGRRAALRQLTAETREGACTAPTVWVIVGMPGVGKTRLAVHAAHLLVASGRFDDVQLWADLRGYDPRQPPTDPADVLATFLTLLGVPRDALPADLAARAALFRSHLASRRALVLLDNAADTEQVRPLLPGNPGGLTLITTRRQLSTLDGSRVLPLDVFDRAEAVELLARIAGAGRIAAQPQDTARVVRLCGHLPIALAHAAGQLRVHRAWAVRDLAARLDGAEERVWGAFDLSYRALAPSQRRLFRLLGLYPGTEVTVPEAAALADLAPGDAGALLEDLLDEHLVSETMPGRYRLHDLVRDYAGGRVHGEAPREQHYAALDRLVRHCLSVAVRATRALYPAESRRIGAGPDGEDHRGTTIGTAAEASRGRRPICPATRRVGSSAWFSPCTGRWPTVG